MAKGITVLGPRYHGNARAIVFPQGCAGSLSRRVENQLVRHNSQNGNESKLEVLIAYPRSRGAVRAPQLFPVNGVVGSEIQLAAINREAARPRTV